MSRRYRTHRVDIRQSTGPWTIIGWIFIISFVTVGLGVAGCAGCSALVINKAIEESDRLEREEGPICSKCFQRHHKKEPCR